MVGIFGLAVNKKKQSNFQKNISYEKNSSELLDTVINEVNPLYYQSIFDSPKGKLQVQFHNEWVTVRPYPNESDTPFFKSFDLHKTDYPKLFQQGVANSSFLSAELDTKNYKLNVFNNEPDHGYFSPSYQLIIDLRLGKVEENTHPRRDESLPVEDRQYLDRYPEISKLIGNQSLQKLEKKQLIIGEAKLESVVTIPYTAINEQELYIFDNNSTYLKEKGYSMRVKVIGKNIEIRYQPDFDGIGFKNLVVVKIFEFDQVKKTFVKTKEYEETVTGIVCPNYEISKEEEQYFIKYLKVANLLSDNCEVILRKQNLVSETLPLEVVFAGGRGCASCHAQSVYIFDENSIFLVESGADIRVKVVNNTIVVKSQLSGGGAPSPGTMGVVKVYDVDNEAKTLTKIKEYQEEYTLEDYEGK